MRYTDCMGRQLRLEFKGSSYHITVRRNGKEDLYADNPDRAYLLRRLSESEEQFGVRVRLFGLMRNHIHLVVERPMLALVGGLRDERRNAPRGSPSTGIENHKGFGGHKRDEMNRSFLLSSGLTP
ncbi:MAG: transposase [bacterium]